MVLFYIVMILFIISALEFGIIFALINIIAGRKFIDENK